MRLGAVAAVVLVITGAVTGVALLAILGIVVGAAETVRWLWSRGALGQVRYERALTAPRIPWGEEIELKVAVANRRRLPLAWLRAVDDTSVGVYVRTRPDGPAKSIGALDNSWTLAPNERVVRHLWIGADRRGIHTIGPTYLSVGDMFARDAGDTRLEGIDRFVVWPRIVPAPGVARAEHWGDVDRAASGLLEDPARFAGVRSYSPGDPLRHIHARSSARLGHPVTKRFEPSSERRILLALDVQTAPGRGWDIANSGGADEDVETLYVVAASLTRALADDGASLGLTAAGFSRAMSRYADVKIGSGRRQADRVLDMLARLSPFPSVAFEVLLARIPRRFAGGATVLVLTLRDPTPFVPELRALRRAGFGVALLCCGSAAAADAAAARRTGLRARAVRLDAPWPTATRLAAA